MATFITRYFQSSDTEWGFVQGTDDPQLPPNTVEISRTRHDQLEADLQRKIDRQTREQYTKSLETKG